MYKLIAVGVIALVLVGCSGSSPQAVRRENCARPITASEVMKSFAHHGLPLKPVASDPLLKDLNASATPHVIAWLTPLHASEHTALPLRVSVYDANSNVVLGWTAASVPVRSRTSRRVIGRAYRACNVVSYAPMTAVTKVAASMDDVGHRR